MSTANLSIAEEAFEAFWQALLEKSPVLATYVGKRQSIRGLDIAAFREAMREAFFAGLEGKDL